MRVSLISSLIVPSAGRRDEQLAALGKAIKALVLEPSEYDCILGGYGLEAAAAVAAFEAVA